MKTKLSVILLTLSLAISAVIFSACAIDVPNPNLKTLTLNKTTLTLEEGQKETLTITENTTGAVAVWSVEGGSTNIVTVNNGEVTAVAEGGPINVVVTAGDLTAKCAVTVTKATPSVPAYITTSKATLTNAFNSIDDEIAVYSDIEDIFEEGIEAIESATTEALATTALNNALEDIADIILSQALSSTAYTASTLAVRIEGLLVADEGEPQYSPFDLAICRNLISAFAGDITDSTALQNAVLELYNEELEPVFEYVASMSEIELVIVEGLNPLYTFRYLSGNDMPVYDIAFDGILNPAFLNKNGIDTGIIAYVSGLLAEEGGSCLLPLLALQPLKENLTFANYNSYVSALNALTTAYTAEINATIDAIKTNLLTGAEDIAQRTFIYFTYSLVSANLSSNLNTQIAGYVSGETASTAEALDEVWEAIAFSLGIVPESTEEAEIFTVALAFYMGFASLETSEDPVAFFSEYALNMYISHSAYLQGLLPNPLAKLAGSWMDASGDNQFTAESMGAVYLFAFNGNMVSVTYNPMGCYDVADDIGEPIGAMCFVGETLYFEYESSTIILSKTIESPLVGTWIANGGVTLVINADYSFELYANNDYTGVVVEDEYGQYMLMDETQTTLYFCLAIENGGLTVYTMDMTTMYMFSKEGGGGTPVASLEGSWETSAGNNTIVLSLIMPGMYEGTLTLSGEEPIAIMLESGIAYGYDYVVLDEEYEPIAYINAGEGYLDYFYYNELLQLVKINFFSAT